ncbi:MAG TPA: cupin domain-containing protein [Actinomycetota bacterium]|nr:cupin domain-containing protein [Actinomycetota bacterium]
MAKGRVFLRGITSERYGLGAFRREILSAPRVRGDEVVVDDASVGHSGDSQESRTWWRIGPGDEPFLTQTLQVHFVELPPGTSNHGHGHQNEAVFYILEGRGYEIHDDRRYDWEEGDLVVAHVDSVHRHFNASDTERALAIVMKAKSLWMYMGLIQQGRSGPVEDEARFGPREDWSQLWTPGLADRIKVVRRADTSWETTAEGRVRVITSMDRIDQRIVSVDVYEQEIPPAGRSGRHWHMADEVLYVVSGRGRSLQWDVEAEIAERYYARVAKEPIEHAFTAGDTIYVPTNTVHQHLNDGEEPLRLLSGQNRIFRHIGYDNVVVLEPAPESAERSARPAES